MNCQVCGIRIGQKEISEYAALGGLPSPCCQVCFAVNDFTIKSAEELKEKSLSRRKEILTGDLSTIQSEALNYGIDISTPEDLQERREEVLYMLISI